MRKIHLENAKAGVRTAKAVFNSDGRVLLSCGVLLKDKYIERLKSNGIKEIYIDDDISKDIEIEDVICEQTRVEAKQIIKCLMGNYALSQTLNTTQIIDIIDKIIDELLSRK